MLFYGSAREGMHDFLSSVRQSRSVVLLPSFIGWSPNEGSGVYDPVVALGFRASFYDIESDMSAELHDVERLLAATPNAILVVLHYFGRTDPRLPELSALAVRYGALLIEDLAHGFFSAQERGAAGQYGDLSLFSLHKMFPRADGGAVMYSRPGLVTTQIETRPELAHFAISYNWRAIADARRRTYLELEARLRETAEYGADFEFVWPSIEDSDVPQTLPARILGGGRDSIYLSMNERGYGMVSLYHTLIRPLDGYASMQELAGSIINFPVHQDVKNAQLPGLVESFRECLARRKRNRV
jgi:Predicted pyridoxal phosphate-dependent enzyme apparently involved in regulation of cell wall biogenesis